MEHILFFSFLFVTSFLFSKIEIEIEGPDGWAAKLDTKRFPPEHFLSRYVFSGRPATLYHIYILLFIILMSHIPHLFVTQTSPSNRRYSLSSSSSGASRTSSGSL